MIDCGAKTSNIEGCFNGPESAVRSIKNSNKMSNEPYVLFSISD